MSTKLDSIKINKILGWRKVQVFVDSILMGATAVAYINVMALVEADIMTIVLSIVSVEGMLQYLTTNLSKSVSLYSPIIAAAIILVGSISAYILTESIVVTVCCWLFLDVFHIVLSTHREHYVVERLKEEYDLKKYGNEVDTFRNIARVIGGGIGYIVIQEYPYANILIVTMVIAYVIESICMCVVNKQM